MRHNPVPPPPRDWSHLPQWIKKTFPDGTSCMMREDRPAYSPSKYGHVMLPAGTKGRVVFVGDNRDDSGREHWYLNEVELVFAPYPSYRIPDDAWLHLSWPEVWEVLEPLDDHWVAQPKPMSRYTLPSSQKRTSRRRIRPNGRLHLDEVADLLGSADRLLRDGNVDGAYKLTQQAESTLGTLTGPHDARRRRLGYALADMYGKLAHRRANRRLSPNSPPPVPTHRPVSHPAYVGWHKRTFAPGTRVRYTGPVNVWVPRGKSGQTVPLPADTRGEVLAWIGGSPGSTERVSIRLYDNRSYMPHGTDRDTMDWVFDHVLAGGDPVVVDSVTNLWRRLEALDDNWAASPAPLKRHHLPSSQRRTSYKLRPNRQVSVHDFGSVPKAEAFLRDRGFTFEGGKWSRGSLRATVGEYPHGVEVKTMTTNGRRTSRKRTAKRTSRARR